MAALNGTLRDDENQICQNCGGVGHRKYDCPEQRNFTANIICRICGSAGHMARDCTVKPDPNAPPGGSPYEPNDFNSNKGFDSEYASLMAELGESEAGATGRKMGWGSGAGLDITAGGANVPPWRRPEMWQSSTPGTQQQNPMAQNGYRPPQGYQSGYPAGYGQSTWAQAGYGQAGYPQQDYSAAYAQYYQNQYNGMQNGTPV